MAEKAFFPCRNGPNRETVVKNAFPGEPKTAIPGGEVFFGQPAKTAIPGGEVLFRQPARITELDRRLARNGHLGLMRQNCETVAFPSEETGSVRKTSANTMQNLRALLCAARSYRMRLL